MLLSLAIVLLTVSTSVVPIGGVAEGDDEVSLSPEDTQKLNAVMKEIMDKFKSWNVIPLQKCGWFDDSETVIQGYKPDEQNYDDESQDVSANNRPYLWKPPAGLLVSGSNNNISLGPISVQNWCQNKTHRLFPIRQRHPEDHDDGQLSSNVKSVDNITLFSNGSLRWNDPDGRQHTKGPIDFCLSDSIGTDMGFQICESSPISGSRTVISIEPDDLTREVKTVPKVSHAFDQDSPILQKCGFYLLNPRLNDSNSTDDGSEISLNIQERSSSVSDQWNPPAELITRGYDGAPIKEILLGPSRPNWCKTKKSFRIRDSLNSESPFTEYDMKAGLPDTRFAHNITLFQNGTLHWVDIQGLMHFRNRTDFCLSHGSGKGVEFEICQSSCSSEIPCVPKCCPENQVVDAENRKCIPTETYWEPTFYRDVNKKGSRHPHYSLHIGLPCTRTYLIQSNKDKIYPNLLLNGTLYLVNSNIQNKVTRIQPGEFCIDGIIYHSVLSPRNGTPVTYSESEWDQVIIACSLDELEIPSWIPPLYATVNHTAALFLFLTALVYLLLWSHQNIHGWLQFSYALSLFFAFNFLAIVQIWSKEIYTASPDICTYLGWLIHLTFLSAFFFLTSMNFDLWWRFSGDRYLHMIRSRPSRDSIKRFCLFALFALGFPVLILGCAIALDYIYKDRPGDAIIKLPRFGAKKCYFEDTPSQFPFFYGPVGILLLINLIFFTSTVLHLRKIRSNTELARAHSTLEDKKGVRLIAKLFIVMGVLWIFEFISWAANVIFPNKEILLIWVFMPTDILNSLQGIAIFVIFICKPNILSQLKAKYQWTYQWTTNEEKPLSQSINPSKP